MDTVTALISLIQRSRLDLSDEKRLQVDLAEVLSAQGVPYVREPRLSPRDVPDFLVDGHIVLECKLHRVSKMAVFRQLCRYAEYPEIAAVILATNRSMGLPQTHCGTPLFLASLGRGWL